MNWEKSISAVSLIVALLALAIALTSSNSITYSPLSAQTDKEAGELTATATGEASAPPDQCKITFSVETQAADPKSAANQNKEIYNRIIGNLKKLGYRDQDLETVSYNIQPIYSEDRRITGYRVTHTTVLTIVDSDLEKLTEKASKALGTIVDSGANRVEDISFGLTMETYQKLRRDALREALINCRDKAEDMAETLNVELGKIKQVNEYSYFSLPFKVEAAAETPIMPVSPPSELIVTVQVTIVYSLP